MAGFLPGARALPEARNRLLPGRLGSDKNPPAHDLQTAEGKETAPARPGALEPQFGQVSFFFRWGPGGGFPRKPWIDSSRPGSFQLKPACTRPAHRRGIVRLDCGRLQKPLTAPQSPRDAATYQRHDARRAGGRMKLPWPQLPDVEPTQSAPYVPFCIGSLPDSVIAAGGVFRR
jgi:hypothetical protein